MTAGMELDNAILLQDALEMQTQMTKEEFVSCVKECVRPKNAQAWDDAAALIAQFGTRRKALNHIEREIERHRNDFFAAYPELREA